MKKIKKKKKYKYKYKYLYASLEDVKAANANHIISSNISTTSSISDTSFLETPLSISHPIFPQSVPSRLEKRRNTISDTHSPKDTLKIEVRNLIGDSCIVSGTENSVFYEFLNKVPMTPALNTKKLPNVVVVYNGKVYSLSTKWKGVLKDGDTVHIYRKMDDEEINEMRKQRLKRIADKYVTDGTQTEDPNLENVNMGFIWNLFLTYLLYFLLNQLKFNII